MIQADSVTKCSQTGFFENRHVLSDRYDVAQVLQIQTNV